MGGITVSRRSILKGMGLLGVSTLAGCATLAGSPEQPDTNPTSTDEEVDPDELTYEELIEHIEEDMWISEEDKWGDREVVYETLIEAKRDFSTLQLFVYWVDADDVRIDESWDTVWNLSTGERWRTRLTYSSRNDSEPPVDEIELGGRAVQWELV